MKLSRTSLFIIGLIVGMLIYFLTKSTLLVFIAIGISGFVDNYFKRQEFDKNEQAI